MRTWHISEYHDSILQKQALIGSRLQYEIDHRTAGPAEDAAEAEAAAQAGDLDEDMFDEDEFGLAYGIDHGIFSEDFMLYN